MLKNRLAPYIFISVLIHTGLLFGVHSFLSLPDAPLKPPVLIPVEMVVQSKQPSAPAFTITASEPVDEKKEDSVTLSQSAVALDADSGSHDIADPAPAEGSSQSSLNLEVSSPGRTARMAGERSDPVRHTEATLSRTPLRHLFPAEEQLFETPPDPEKSESSPHVAASIMSTLPVSSINQEGAEAASEPVWLAVEETALHLAAVEPSMPFVSVPSDISISADPAAAESAVIRDSLPEGAEAVSEAVDLAVEETPLHLAAVEPSMPYVSAPSDMSIPVDFAAVESAVIRDSLPGGAGAASSAVDLAIKETALHLAAAEPSMPLMSVPSDMSIAVDSAAIEAAVITDSSPEGAEAASSAVDLAIEETALHLAAVEPSFGTIHAPSDMSLSVDLVEVVTAVNPHFPLMSNKAVKYLEGVQTGDDFTAGLRPLPKRVEGAPYLMTSTIQIKGKPSGAQVIIDGRPSGETPMDMELPLGKYEVQVELRGYEGWASQIDLTVDNKSRPITYRLLKIE